MVKLCFSDLVDMVDLKYLFDARFAATGIPGKVINPDGHVLLETGLENASRKKPTGTAAPSCECGAGGDPETQAELLAGRPVESRCKHGLFFIHVPVTVNGKLVATLLSGPCNQKDAPPSKREAAASPSAEKCRDCLTRIPRISRREAENIMAYDIAMSRLLSDVSLKNQLLDEELQHRMQTEETLRQATRRFQEALQTSRHILYRRNLLTGGYDYLSPVVAEMLGTSLAELMANGQQVIWGLMHPDDRPRIQAYMESLNREHPQQHQLEFRLRCADGKYHWFSDSASIVYGAAGKAEAIIGVTHDVTRRKQLELELANTKTLLESAFSESPNGMVLVDATEHRLITGNAAALKIIGFNPSGGVADLVGKRVAELPCSWKVFTPDGRLIPPEEWILCRAIRGEVTLSEDCRIRRADDSESWCIAHCTPIHDRTTGGIVAAMLILEDITRRQLAEQQRRELEAQLQKKSQAELIGNLAGGIAHDFNNLLMTVLGNQELVSAALPPASPLQHNLGDIGRAVHKAADLCRQMLAYAGKGKYIVQRLDLSEAVRNLHRLLESATHDTAEIRLQLAERLPPVEADPSQLRQAIMNLVINAAEAIGNEAPGTITISTGMVEAGGAVLPCGGMPSGACVYLEVADTGCGMDEKTQEHAFDPFFSTKFTGRGLGLAAVQGIVRNHGGLIRAQSTPGKGSTFTIFLPAAAKAAVAHAPAAAHAPPSWRGSGTVLVVDDEPDMCELAAQSLGNLGFRVLTAEDGASAVRIFRENAAASSLPIVDRICCVLLDYAMPGLDGEQTLAELQRIAPAANVILVSGSDTEDLEQLFLGKGLAEILPKPFGMQALADVMYRATAKHHAA